LELAGNKIGPEVAKYLAKLTNLQSLNLRDNNVTDIDKVILSKILKNCEVEISN
jgi:Leucine-rich repeat (LRR) protein